MTVRLIKMVNGTDIIATVVDPPNKLTDNIILSRPMTVTVGHSSLIDDTPIIALRLMNFFGKSDQINIPVDAVLYQTEPRKSLENFYLHTVQNYFEEFNDQIEIMLDRVYKSYIESTTEVNQDEQLLQFMKKIIPTSNTTLQ